MRGFVRRELFVLLGYVLSVSKKTTDFQTVANKKLREQGLLQLKAKEFTSVNDCFQLEHNAVIGIFL